MAPSVKGEFGKFCTVVLHRNDVSGTSVRVIQARGLWPPLYVLLHVLPTCVYQIREVLHNDVYGRTQLNCDTDTSVRDSFFKLILVSRVQVDDAKQMEFVFRCTLHVFYM